MVLYNEHRTDTIVVASVCIPIATLAVILRFFARFSKRQSYYAEEWLAVGSLTAFLAYGGISIYESDHGSGYDPRTLPYPVLVAYLKFILPASILVAVSIAAAKASILMLYMRVFSVDDRFFLSVKIAHLLNIMWLIAAILSLVFQCSPVEKAWNPLKKGKCFSFAKLTIAIEVPNALLDFAIMALPMSMLRKLQVRLHDKLVLAVVFFLGGMVGIIGFVRIAILYRPQHFNRSATGQWVMVQLTLAIICCCAPTYRPLLKYFSLFQTIKSRYHSITRGGTSGRSTAPRSNVGHDESMSNRYYLGEIGPERRILTVVEGNAQNDSLSEDRRDYHSKTIDVQRTVEMV